MAWMALAACAVTVTAAAATAKPEVKEFAGKQIELCMIGDSITWAGNGDCFRLYLLDHMPQLAFVGTHSAKYGYSHAGEGGNNTSKVIARLKDVPDSRYYHLLLGVNDNAASRNAEQVPAVAQKTVDALVKIVNELAARPGTEKVFLGSLLPCGDDGDPASMKNQFRDMGNVKANEIFRAKFKEYFPSCKVVWVEYENALRPRDDWRKIIRLHPTPEGYTVIAGILAEVLKKETMPAVAPAAAKYAVEVVNLWDAEKKCTSPLIPGWYTVSFKVDALDGGELKVTAKALNAEKLKFQFNQTFAVLNAKPGARAEFMLYTGAEGYGYSMASIAIEPVNGKISDLLVEKMRPSQKASIYGVGTYLDDVSPMSLGEKLVPVKP
jgi:lysophospholipase L1-like esterase